MIILKKEKRTNKAFEKDVQLEIYEPYNKTKLNLSFCQETGINIYVKGELSDEIKYSYEQLKSLGYDMFNLNNPFYQDICAPFTSYRGTDIILSDRVNYIYNNDDTKCQSNCKLSKYSEESEYLNCSCTINEEVNNMNKEVISKKIYESFFDTLKYSNYKVLKCYNLVFTKYLIGNNIGSNIVLAYILIYLGCFIVFLIKGIEPLKKKLELDIRKKFESNDLKNINKDGENLIKIIKKKKRKKSKNLRNKQLKSTVKLTTEKDIINRIEDIKELDNFELNELDFYKAIKFDKRTFIQIYWSKLKRENPILFTFLTFDDYNLLYIKLVRFIFLITTDMVMNIFFFSDESMHKLYLSYGKYDFIQQIPQILYSNIVSKILEIFLCYLSLTDKPIFEIKKLVLHNYSANTTFKRIYIKLLIFFIFTFIFILFNWYVVSAFCSVYKNTQFSYIKDWIYTFILGILFNFAIYLIPSGLRLYALKKSNSKGASFIYKLSEIIPIF